MTSLDKKDSAPHFAVTKLKKKLSNCKSNSQTSKSRSFIFPFINVWRLNVTTSGKAHFLNGICCAKIYTITNKVFLYWRSAALEANDKGQLRQLQKAQLFFLCRDWNENKQKQQMQHNNCMVFWMKTISYLNWLKKWKHWNCTLLWYKQENNIFVDKWIILWGWWHFLKTFGKSKHRDGHFSLFGTAYAK